jgi:hypothetical protein
MAAANQEVALTAGGFSSVSLDTMIKVKHVEQVLGVRKEEMRTHRKQTFCLTQNYNFAYFI